jgi:hypothetical protein
MSTRFVQAVLLLIALAAFGGLACDFSFNLGQASKPQITLQAPASGTSVRDGDEVSIVSLSTDAKGIVRVELSVDGVVVRADAPPIPQGQTSFTLAQTWKATPGTHTLSVRAFNASGGASDPAFVSIDVAPGTVVLPTPVVVVPTGAPSPFSLTPLPTPLSLTPIAPSSPAVQPSATRTATRPAPTATRTLAAPSGVWAISIVVDPPNPKRGTFANFKVTFLNSTGEAKPYRWFVKIYEPDKRNSFGETSKLTSTIPPGTTTITAPADWRIGAMGDCQSYIARAFWEDPADRQVYEFIKPDQSGGPAAPFQECP